MEQKNITPADVFKAFTIGLRNDDVEMIKRTLSGFSINSIEDISVNQNITFTEALKPFISHISIDSSEPSKEVIDDCLACIEINNTGTDNLDWMVLKKEFGVWKLAPLTKVNAVKKKLNFREKVFAFVQTNFGIVFKENESEGIRKKGKIYRT